MKEDSNAKLDIDIFGNEEESQKMVDALKLEVLEMVNASPDYKNLFLGISEEAAEKNVI